MKLQTIQKFLTAGSASVQAGDITAIAIHPASEVDQFDIGGLRVGVGAIMPINRGATPAISSTRRSWDPTQPINLNPADGNDFPGERLVLQLYEPCDPLVPPGPRVPVYGSTSGKALPTTALGAKLIARVPFSNRKSFALYYVGNGSTDITVILRPELYGLVQGGQSGMQPGQTQLAVETTDTWPGATPLDLTQAFASTGKVVYIGGGGDNAEYADEIKIFAYAAAAAQTAGFNWQVSGERHLG